MSKVKNSNSNSVLFVGKPNCGKSSLFNTLTGLNQKVGNYSGVTVDIKSGQIGGLTIVDLPGLQSLVTKSPEEIISRDKILSDDSESTVVFICNGMQLSDSLVLFSQLADIQIKMVVVVNFKDELAENKVEVDIEKMQSLLGCPVTLVNSKTGEGKDSLLRLLMMIKDKYQTRFVEVTMTNSKEITM